MKIAMGEEREKAKAFIQDMDLWPRWPYLPLKKRGSHEVGFLYGDGTLTVYKLNIYEFKDAASAPRQTYADVDALLDDGWWVD